MITNDFHMWPRENQLTLIQLDDDAAWCHKRALSVEEKTQRLALSLIFIERLFVCTYVDSEVWKRFKEVFFRHKKGEGGRENVSVILYV